MIESRFSGSLWVTHHEDRKIAGCESIMAVCRGKCAFEKFCYSQKLQKFMRESFYKAAYNTIQLEGNGFDFVAPHFRTEVVRWFSMGSCNGNETTLKRVDYSVDNNPSCYHAIWVEPHYWLNALPILKGNPDINMVYSNKMLDSVSVVPGHISFNLTTSEETHDRLLREHPEAISCMRQCNACGWKCYKLEEGVVVENVNTRHGSP